MDQLNYRSFYQVLNSKDYGIPQNRERVFTISIRKDLGQSFVFPPKQELKLKLKDMLEDEVDEKYYLSDKMIEYISATGTANFKNPDSKINLDVARPLTTDQNKRAGTTNYLSDDLPSNYNLNEVVRKYGVFDKKNQKHQAESVYDENGLSPTLDTMQGGWRQPCIEIKQVGQLWGTEKERNPQDGRIYDSFGLTPTLDTKHTPKILIKNATKKGYLEATEGDAVDISSRMQWHRGTVQKESVQTLDTQCNIGVVVKK
jgi:DNA (cytosine-5)-methyltransferase 1